MDKNGKSDSLTTLTLLQLDECAEAATENALPDNAAPDIAAAD